DLTGQITGHGVDVVGQVLPGAADALHDGLAAELALGADLARDARYFRGEDAQLLDHSVDDLRRAEVFALERATFDLEGHGLREVALRDRADHAGHVGR